MCDHALSADTSVINGATAGAAAFAAGVGLLQMQAALPTPAWGLAFIPAALMAVIPARRLRWLAPIAALAAGFLWAAMLAQARLADRLDPGLEGRDIDVTGVVSGLSARGERGIAFDFEPETNADGLRLPGKIRLAWYRAFAEPVEEGADELRAEAPPAPGERWRFTVRLRRPHGNVNPGGFDYEAYLLERGIGATGYVRSARSITAVPERLGFRGSFRDRVEQLRDTVRTRFFRVLGATPEAGVLAALAIGDQRVVSSEEWRLFQRTGVTHLMSISGLHVTLISGMAAWLLGFLWRRSARLCLLLPARKAAAATAVLGALAYTLLAGFAVPAQRTLYMVAVVSLALWSGRLASPSRTLALALAVVVALDPWAVLAAGFWLSFGAVALIFYVAAGRLERGGWLTEWARVQWAITLGLAPATLLFFGQVSVAGPVANAIAIPLVSGLITPLALMGAVIPADALLVAGGWLVDGLLIFLEWCAGLPSALWTGATPPMPMVLLALAGIAWLLAPRGVPSRIAGLALVAPAFAWIPPAPAEGEAWVTTLDVGQGLAVLVRTATRTLLYDAGPAWTPESDTGSRVILPLLASQGIGRLDAMVLSHQDHDHVGGAASVLAALETDLVRSSLPLRHDLLALSPERRRCLAGERWQWDGVAFAFLHPQPADYRDRRRANDLSCVLRIEAGGRSMLLAGDIERNVEDRLVAAGGLKSDVLLVPHHGSRTSSTQPFVEAVEPKTAIVTAGYRNRFGHPAPDVMARYSGIDVLRTDRDGAVTVRLGDGLTTVAERRVAARYWR